MVHKPFILILISLLFLATSAFAGGPLYITSDGTASVWDNTTAITYAPEAGTCATLSNSDVIALIDDTLAIWSDLDETDLSFASATGLIAQVGVDNYNDYLYIGTGTDDDLASDGINPVIFDDDAEIVAELAGEANRYAVLGLAAPSGFSDDGTEIIDGQAILNCRCLEDHPSGPCYADDGQSTYEYTSDDLQFVILHEFGHFLNLDHSQVNFEDYFTGDYDGLPIMLPFIFTPDTLAPSADDKAAIGSLYPDAAMDLNYCTVTGTLVNADGDEVRCVDVWAIPTDATQTISAISGQLATAEDGNDDLDTVDDGECLSDCGSLVFRLPEGQAYTFTIEPIDATMTGGSSVGPCVNGQIEDVEAEELITIDANACVAGETYALGELASTQDLPAAGTDTSGSTGGSGSGGSSGGSSGASGGAAASDDDLNPVGYMSCGLRPPFFSH